MHDTAMLTGNAFFRCYGDVLGSNAKILDVGSQDVNGSLRNVAPAGSSYTGVDLAPGRGVDVVLEDPHRFPMADHEFDLVVSTSGLEHDAAFWLTFMEMARVVRPGGFVYVSAPANGPYHGYPVDCWRFYPDSAAALSKWSTRCGVPLDVVESFQVMPRQDIWLDQVMVFGRRPIPARERIEELL